MYFRMWPYLEIGSQELEMHVGSRNEGIAWLRFLYEDGHMHTEACALLHLATYMLRYLWDTSVFKTIEKPEEYVTAR